ncbi:uncharacterized protein [Magallana gigas]|uniref:uncharacterized protein n=1 Tax=Magallana gigas TaxID=29159 RepID=UPI00334292A7
MSVGLLYVENRTCTLLSEEIVAHLGKEKVITHGIEEKNTTADKLTHTSKLIVKHIGEADSFIVIVDDVHWKTFWNETSNKIPNKLEELLDEDDDTASKRHNFILVVGINTNKNEEIKENEFNKFLGCQSISLKVCHMLKSLEDHTPNTVNRLAKEIVEKFTNQLCPEEPPVVSIEPKWTHPVSTEEGKNNMATESHSGNSKADEGNTSDTQEPDFTVPSTSSEDEDQEDINCYNLKTPGLCLYIVELEFDPEDENVQLEKRHASIAEFGKIKDAFERLGCFVKKKTNPTKQEALEFLQKGKEWCEKLKPSFLVLIISTHGQEVPDITKEKNSAPVKPSEGIGKTRSKKEMVHQLFFHDGQTLLTKDIIQMFGRRSCPALTEKPCTFFIQACRSRFGVENHVNYDEGAILSVNSTENMMKERQSETDSEDASKGDPLKDTSDAKRSIIKRSKEDEEERVREITARYKIDQFGEYMTWFRNTNAPSLASEDDSEAVQKLREALNCDVLKPQETEEIMVLCKGYEKYTLDFFYPEPSVSDPAPCTNDSLVMFASAPGKEAYNRERQGGWLITNLEAQIKETLDQKPKKVDLLAELTKVSGRIAFNYETETGSLMDSGHKSVPCLYHRLSKDIIIWPEEMEKTMQLLVEKEGSEWEKFTFWDP